MAEKCEFRESWARAKYAHIRTGKRYTKEYANIDINSGRYMTFGAVVLKYGGFAWKPAAQG